MTTATKLFWRRFLGVFLGVLGLIIFAPALWNFLGGFWTANVFIDQQGNGSALVFLAQILGCPLVALLYPFYWLLAFGDFYYLIEGLTLALGWTVFALGLDLASYIVVNPVTDTPVATTPSPDSSL